MRGKRLFKRGASRRRSVRRTFTEKGWLLLLTITLLIVVAALLMSQGALRGMLGFFDTHRHAHAAADTQGR